MKSKPYHGLGDLELMFTVCRLGVWGVWSCPKCGTIYQELPVLPHRHSPAPLG